MGTQPAPPKGGRAPPNCSPISIVAKRLDAPRSTWYGARPQPRGLCVRWGPSPLPIFGKFILCPNGWMHQDATWYGGRPQPRRLFARWGPSSPPPKGGGAPSPIFGKLLLYPNGYMHHDATWYGGKPQPKGLCVRWGPSLPSPKRRLSPFPNFRPMSIVAKRLDGSR